jgi:hypothetical protein
LSLSFSREQLENAQREVQSYAVRHKRKVENDDGLTKDIFFIAIVVAFAREVQSARPSNLQFRQHAKKCARALEQSSGLLTKNWETTVRAATYYAEPANSLFELVDQLRKVSTAFQTLAISQEFNKKGRPSNEFDANVLLLLLCRDLLKRYGGKYPGFTKGTITPGPLVRLANHVFPIVSDGEPPSFSRILKSLKQQNQQILPIYQGKKKPLLDVVSRILSARA